MEIIVEVSDKKKAAQKLINKFLKDHKLQEKKNVKIGFYSDDETIGVIDRQATGILPFDLVTNGGFVKGHINLIIGGEGVGKTCHMLGAIAHAQQNYQPFLDAYLNNEKSFDRVWAKKKGIVDEIPVIIGEFETTEESADFCLDCTNPESGVDRLFIDTLQALAPEGELRDKKDDRSVADCTMALGILALLSRN